MLEAAMSSPPATGEPARPGFLSTELANSVTHGVGLGLSIAGLAVLVVFAVLHGSARHVVACSVYGATLVALYLTSTMYHSIQEPSAKRVWRILDHSAIYLLIAGTYTPFALVTLRGGWGWSTFGVVWGLAILGILFKAFTTGRYRAASLVVYLLMGWLALVILKPLLSSLHYGGVIFLLVGGLFYTVGVIFYLARRIPHHHAIWHLFVMIGSTCHFFAVMFYVLPWSDR